MKKAILSLSVIAIMATILVSFDKTHPKDVAETWLTSFYHMDFEAAKKISTTDTKALLTQLTEFSSLIPDSVKDEAKNIVININDVAEDGDKATVTYKALSGKKGDPGEGGTLKLVKQSGQWLVLFTKDDVNASSGKDAGTPTLDDRTNPPAADTARRR